MKFLKFISFTGLFLFGTAHAACINLPENNESVQLLSSDKTSEVCFNLKNLPTKETYIVTDAVIPGYSAPNFVKYSAKLTLSDGTTVFNSTVFNANKSQKLNLAGYTEAKLTLSMPQEGGLYELEDWDYTFNVINNRELQGFSIIYVSLSAKSRKRLNEKPCPPNDKKCRQPRRTGSYIVDKVNSLSQNDAATCTEDNRPPTRPPFDKKDPSIKMNINQVINHERAWFYSSVHNYTPGVARSMSFLRIYNNHKPKAIYDVKSRESKWKGNQDMGNFLYGAVMEAHGFSEGESQRFAAAYQAVQDHGLGFVSFHLGIAQFVFNYGDNPGDKEMVSKGFKYAREVNRKGGFVPDSLSCVPTDTVDRSEGGEGGGATNGGGNFFPIPLYVVCYDVHTNGGYSGSYCVLQPK